MTTECKSCCGSFVRLCKMNEHKHTHPQIRHNFVEFLEFHRFILFCCIFIHRSELSSLSKIKIQSSVSFMRFCFYISCSWMNWFHFHALSIVAKSIWLILPSNFIIACMPKLFHVRFMEIFIYPLFFIYIRINSFWSLSSFFLPFIACLLWLIYINISTIFDWL